MRRNKGRKRCEDLRFVVVAIYQGEGESLRITESYKAHVEIRKSTDV